MTVRTPLKSRGRAPHLGPERRRPQILDTARALAVRSGFGSVTIASLAAEMGVTRPVIYACFPDRVEILSSLLDREQAGLTAAALESLHSSADAETPEQAFIAGFTALLTSAAEKPESWHLIFHGEPDPALSQRLREARGVLTRESTAWIRPAMVRWWDTSDLDRKLPVLIELFMSACESGVRSVLDEGEDWNAEELGRFLGKSLHRAFEAA
ncbi:TetR/AcrR family transcriptional regulator [Gordonia zhaorongruii]|uniref:TetR/AcrR family transcriptional regulator n=1 Tax=Gordonia zhaorongruii TaxID=2597659 RepID=UPI00117C6B35|nr:TetR/AcrR family transcriptional regulator [Gordonia zhaorongruii]